MATDPPNPPRKRTTTFSRRRPNRVKAQIFGSLAAEISSLASRTGRVFSRLKRGGDRDGSTVSPSAVTSTTASSSTSTTVSAAATQPPSAYTSDGDHDHA